MTKVITLHEYESIPYTDIGFANEKTFVEEVKRLNKRYSPSEDGNTGILTLYKDVIKATNYVGFGLLGNVLLQVIPKIYTDESDEYKNVLVLLKLFDSAFGLNIKDWEYNKIMIYLQINTSFYEILIYLFAKHLISELENGFYREYTSYQTTDTFLRGKLILQEEARKLPHQHTTFNVEKTIFNGDNLLNRVFYYTAQISLRHTHWRSNRVLLDDIIDMMDEVQYQKITVDDLSRVKFHRLNQRFKIIFELAKVILNGLQSTKESSIFGFFVDMNRLFENHIYEALRKNNFEVRYQHSIPPLLEKKKREIPDFIIEKSNKPVIVLDAKYKIIRSLDEVSMNDIRQVYSYLKILKKDNAQIAQAILVYPSVSGLSQSQFKFFDGDTLTIMQYDISKIITSENASGYDMEFINKLKEI